MDPEWLLTDEDRVTTNKVTVADLAIWDAKPVEERVAVDLSAATEKVQAPGAVNIPR